MSCGEPHETDCTEILDHLYEFLDREMPDSACAKFEEHFEECSPCLEKYGLEQAVKKLVKRCCGPLTAESDPAGPAATDLAAGTGRTAGGRSGGPAGAAVTPASSGDA
jgi:anti-sigma factor (TIGR02949 family)